MEEMSLPALFEEARKIHLMASESGAEKVQFLTLFHKIFRDFDLIF